MQDPQKCLSSKDEKSLRVKYLRRLQKFANSAICALKKENFNPQKFQEKMLKNQAFFEKSPAVRLYAGYARNLEHFVGACLDFSKSKEELLSLANTLDKQKNQNKKQKHKNYLKEYEG